MSDRYSENFRKNQEILRKIHPITKKEIEDLHNELNAIGEQQSNDKLSKLE